MCRWFNSSPAHCCKILAAKHLRFAAFFMCRSTCPFCVNHSARSEKTVHQVRYVHSGVAGIRWRSVPVSRAGILLDKEILHLYDNRKTEYRIIDKRRQRRRVSS